jgi:hypothetical protein
LAGDFIPAIHEVNKRSSVCEISSFSRGVFESTLLLYQAAYTTRIGSLLLNDIIYIYIHTGSLLLNCIYTDSLLVLLNDIWTGSLLLNCIYTDSLLVLLNDIYTGSLLLNCIYTDSLLVLLNDIYTSSLLFNCIYTESLLVLLNDIYTGSLLINGISGASLNFLFVSFNIHYLRHVLPTASDPNWHIQILWVISPALTPSCPVAVFYLFALLSF